jgi:ATP-dependent DNA ligase
LVIHYPWTGLVSNYRVIAEVDKRHVRLYSRNGLSFTERYYAVAAAMEKMRHQAVLDEEVVALDPAQGDSSADSPRGPWPGVL